MLTIRYGLMYPQDLTQLVMVDPIWLEDWKTKGIPRQSIDGWYEQERQTSADKVRVYERATHYAGTWSPGCEQLVIGDKDTKAIGKNLAPAFIGPTLGTYPVLGRSAAAQIPNANLVEFPTLGHAPQIQDPEAFHKALLDGLTKPQ